MISDVLFKQFLSGMPPGDIFYGAVLFSLYIRAYNFGNLPLASTVSNYTVSNYTFSSPKYNFPSKFNSVISPNISFYMKILP